MNFETLVSRFAENNKWFLEIGESQEVEYLLDFEKLKVSYFVSYIFKVRFSAFNHTLSIFPTIRLCRTMRNSESFCSKGAINAFHYRLSSSIRIFSATYRNCHLCSLPTMCLLPRTFCTCACRPLQCTKSISSSVLPKFGTPQKLF